MVAINMDELEDDDLFDVGKKPITEKTKIFLMVKLIFCTMFP